MNAGKLSPGTPRPRAGGLSWFFAIALLLAASACSRTSGTLDQRLAGPLQGFAGSDEGGARIATKKDDGGAASEDKDYWADVRFDRLRFKEVQEFVRLHYIDPKFDRHFAYQRAANFALHALEEDVELLPESFYRRRKGMAEESKRLAGTVEHLKGGRGWIVLHHQKGWNKDPRKRMNDDEIRKERAKRKKRYQEIKRAWSKVKFDESQFVKLMDYALARAAKKKIRGDEVWLAAAQGFLAALDPHSSLVSKEEWKASTEEIRDASFEGIGALLTQRQEEIIVESPIKGQPAETAGLRAGDVIVKVDKTDVQGKNLTSVVKMIRGPKGTEVVLTVHRVGVPEDLRISIIRSFIPITNVSSRLLGPQFPEFGYVKVRGFIPGVTAELRGTIEALRKKSATGRLRGLLLDLRGNSGGLLQEAVRMSDLFLDRGVIVIVRSRISEDEVYKAEQGGDVRIPMVVLVDDGTASAAEIVANALQENRRAITLGERTFGKATVQSLQPPILGTGYFVKLTIARYYGPKGNTLQVHGVRPDVFTPPDADGKIPLGFREEDLYDHLPEIPDPADPANADLVQLLKPCVAANGLADKIHAADPNPAVKFDNQLYRGADWLECLATRMATSKVRLGGKR